MRHPDQPLIEALLRAIVGAVLGAAIGLVLLSIGLLRAMLAVLGGDRSPLEGLWPDTGLYVLGFSLGGAVLGALWPGRPGRARRYLAGAVGGIVAVTIIARIVEGPGAPWTISTGLMGAALGCLFGVAFVYGLLSGPAA